MNLFEHVLSKNQKNIDFILEDSLNLFHKEIFKLVENLILNLEISNGFINKSEQLKKELEEPQILNINILPKKRKELNSYNFTLSQKSNEISSFIKRIYPILFSNSSDFRKNLQYLFSKATTSSKRDEVSKIMLIILEALDSILIIFKKELNLNSLNINLDKNTIIIFKIGVEKLKKELILIHDKLIYLKQNNYLFE